MKIFDDCIDAVIRTDEKGNRIFFPHGVFTRGKTIPSEQAESELRQYLRKQEAVGLTVGVPFAVVITYLYLKYGAKSLLVFAIPYLLSLAYYRGRINRILKGSQTSDVRLTFDEMVISLLSNWVLWFTTIVVGIFSLAFVGLVLIKPAREGIVGILWAGLIWLIGVILLIKKRKSGEADSPTTPSV